jgi:hypothetical protein
MQYLHLKHKILARFFSSRNTQMLRIKYPSLMIKKQYGDNFEFCYNQKKNKKIKLMIYIYNKKKGMKL